MRLTKSTLSDWKTRCCTFKEYEAADPGLDCFGAYPKHTSLLLSSLLPWHATLYFPLVRLDGVLCETPIDQGRLLSLVLKMSAL